jgi:hypothetical protein
MSGLPAAVVAARNVGRMEICVDRFRAALALYDLCEDMRLGKTPLSPAVASVNDLENWADIAGRDACFTVYQFGRLMHGTRVMLDNRASERLTDEIDREKLERGIAAFGRRFKGWTVAPSGASDTPDDGESAAQTSAQDFMEIAGKTGASLVGGILRNGRTFTVYARNRTISCRLDADSLASLARAQLIFSSAFKSAKRRRPVGPGRKGHDGISHPAE